MQRGVEQCKVPDPIQRQGITTHTTPAIQQGHRLNDKRGRQHADGGRQHSTGMPATQHPALHSPCHLPSAMPPHHPRWPHPPRRGGSAQRIPHHTNNTDTHPHHNTTHPAIEQYTTRTAILASTAVGRVGHEPHHCTGRDSSSTHHRHSTHRGGWTPSTHPLIYSHSFMFTQQMINVDQ